MNVNKKKGMPQFPTDKKRIAIIAAIVVILLLNVMWTVLQNKFAPKVAEVRADLTKLEERLTRLEQGGLPDVADLRDQFSALKDIAKGYEGRLAELVKAEEAQLATMQAQAEAQKARVEALKQQMAPVK